MNILNQIAMFLGYGIIVLAIVIVILYIIAEIREYRNKNGKHIFFGQKTVGRFLMHSAESFRDDPHAFNALYLLGKALENGGKRTHGSIVKEVKELNNLKCK